MSIFRLHAAYYQHLNKTNENLNAENIFYCFITILHFLCFSQEKSIEKFLSDSSLIHASVSLCVADAETGEILCRIIIPEKVLLPHQ